MNWKHAQANPDPDSEMFRVEQLEREQTSLKLLAEVMEEREREQWTWIRNRSRGTQDFKHACRLFGIDERLDTTEKHLPEFK